MAAPAELLRPAKTEELTSGADGQPLTYPVPLVVRNTFIDTSTLRPESLEGFFCERQVASCPTSMVFEPGATMAGAWDHKLSQAPPQEAEPHCQVEPFVLRLEDAVGPGLPPFASQQTENAQAAWTQHRAPDHGSLPRLLQQQQPMPATYDKLQHLPPPPLPPGRELPSVGSAGHYVGDCKPCAFMHSKGCSSGKDCTFCHICDAGEKKRRQKDKRAFFGGAGKLKQFVMDGLSSFQLGANNRGHHDGA